MSAPPEYRPDLTDTQRRADDIATAMRNLARDWPHMHRPGDTQAPGMESRTGVHLDDHDPRDTDQRRIDRTISLRRYVVDVLNGWCRVVIEDRGTTHGIPDGHQAEQMAAFLERHAEWLSGHEAGEDARDELRELAHRCHLTAYPPVRDSMSIGRCPLEQPGEQDVLEECGGDVRVRLAPDERPGEAYAACNRCGTVAVASWWESQMFDDPETRRWLTDADVVTLVHRLYGEAIAQSTVRQWVRREVLVPSGERDTSGRRLFARDAVVYAIHLHKRRAELRS